MLVFQHQQIEGLFVPSLYPLYQFLIYLPLTHMSPLLIRGKRVLVFILIDTLQIK
jgi:hypothetical protein